MAAAEDLYQEDVQAVDGQAAIMGVLPHQDVQVLAVVMDAQVLVVEGLLMDAQAHHLLAHAQVLQGVAAVVLVVGHDDEDNTCSIFFNSFSASKGLAMAG